MGRVRGGGLGEPERLGDHGLDAAGRRLGECLLGQSRGRWPRPEPSVHVLTAPTHAEATARADHQQGVSGGDLGALEEGQRGGPAVKQRRRPPDRDRPAPPTTRPRGRRPCSASHRARRCAPITSRPLQLGSTPSPTVRTLPRDPVARNIRRCHIEVLAATALADLGLDPQDIRGRHVDHDRRDPGSGPAPRSSPTPRGHRTASPLLPACPRSVRSGQWPWRSVHLQADLKSSLAGRALDLKLT